MNFLWPVTCYFTSLCLFLIHFGPCFLSWKSFWSECKIIIIINFIYKALFKTERLYNYFIMFYDEATVLLKT